MCGLFGFSSYNEQPVKDISKLTNSLARQSAIRGTDATGIAFSHLGNIQIHKDAKSADKMELKHPDNVKCVIGHTRHSTQGSERKNQNNHPFSGRTKNASFALAHNGILWNDDELKKKYHLPKSKIETDSYVAAQLIEYKRNLSFDTLKFMAEEVDGSFSFSILDDKNNLYLVKGDSPISILHFPRLKLYVYASTDEILYRALINTDLLSEIKRKNYDEIVLNEGEIFKISPNGSTEKVEFNFCRSYYDRQWWQFGRPYATPTPRSCDNASRKAYIEELKYYAMYEGIDPEEIDMLIRSGMEPEEVEEYIYTYEGYY